MQKAKKTIIVRRRE